MEKRQSKTILSTVMIAVAAAGMLGGYAMSNTAFESQINAATNNAFLNGHVALTLTDADGNIKDYRQTDNLITTTGENCASKHLFSTSAGSARNTGVLQNSTSGCYGAVTSPFTVIAIGNNTGSTSVGSGNIQLDNEHIGVSGFERATGTTVTFTNATSDVGATNGGNAAKVVITKTFTNNNVGSATVNESGLFNATSGAADNEATRLSTSAMFARQTFSVITVSSGDSLTVEWTVNIGSAPALDTGSP